MKFLNSKVLVALGLSIAIGGFIQAQSPIGGKKKIDGVVGVVGEYVILDSDIEKTLMELKAQNLPIGDLSRCDLFEKLLEDKLFANQAVLDSLEVADTEVTAFMNEQIDRMTEDAGSMDKILKFYNKDNEEDFREYFFDIVKQNKLTQRMQQHIVEKVTITPEEVRQFFKSLPKDELPTIGDEVELAEIVIKPEISKEQKQKVIDRLNDMRKDVLENGASFYSKAVLFTDDRGSAANGGFYSITKKSPFLKEFKDVAFSMAEGEISAPFETEYGYHIIYVEKIRGQYIDLRHILLKPKPTEEAIAEAKKKAEDIRTKIVNKEISFEDAAAASSDEKETKFNGGIMRDPRSMDTRFELNNMEDRELYFLVNGLKEGEVSQVAIKTDRVKEEKYFRIVEVVKKWKEHKIEFADDYMKIKTMALNKKQGEEVEKWVSKKISDAYINIQGEFRNCKFRNNWVKK